MDFLHPKSYRILVADDEQAILDVYRKVFAPVQNPSKIDSGMEELENKLFGAKAADQHSPSFDLTISRQADQAVDAVRRSLEDNHPFAVAFLDVRMPPGPDGVWAAERIRALDPHVEIVFVTGFSDAHPREISRRVQPVHKLLYVQKPFHSQEIFQFASSLGAKWFMERRLTKVNMELESRVEDRTASLARLNEKLAREAAERDQMVKALQDSEIKYRNLFENAHDLIQSVAVDGHFNFVNPAWLEALGYSPEELEHLKLFDILHPDSMSSCQEKFSVVMGGEPVFNIETTFRAKDGRSIAVEGNAFPQIKNGKVIAAQGLFRNVTERKRAEARLRESEYQFRLLFENSGDAIFVIEAEGENTGKIVLANQAAAEMHGYTLEEVLNLRIQDLDTPEASRNIKSRLEKMLAGHWIKEEITHRRKDGTVFQVEMSAGILEIKGRKFILGMDRDITERKNAEESLRKAHDSLELRVERRTRELAGAVDELKTEIAARKEVEKKLKQAKDKEQSANQAKSEFLANMSHELRTPLNHIIGFTQILIDKHFGELNEMQSEYLEDVLTSSMHLLSLINDILDLSKVEAGKLELEPGQVDIRNLLDNSLTLIRQKSLTQNIRLETEIHPDLPVTIEADERKLKQIVYNLLSNAVKFTPDGGTIRLGARTVDAPADLGHTDRKSERLKGERTTQPAAGQILKGQKCIEISVSDTGIGISRENREIIFEPFEQVAGSANSKNKGTGLGLSLSKRLVELHHGKIWVESEGNGRGSKFILVFPL